MTLLEDIFKERANEVSFLEVKYRDDMDFPLPIVTNNLVAETNKGGFEEEVDMVHVIEGMIYILGTDNDSKHSQEYIEFLKKYSDNVEEYIIYDGLKKFISGNIIEAWVYFRCLLALNENNYKARFNYALII